MAQPVVKIFSTRAEAPTAPSVSRKVSAEPRGWKRTTYQHLICSECLQRRQLQSEFALSKFEVRGEERMTVTYGNIPRMGRRRKLSAFYNITQKFRLKILDYYCINHKTNKYLSQIRNPNHQCFGNIAE